MKKILITVVGGTVSVDKKPDDVEIEIRDYDIEDDFGPDNVSCKEDKDGDRYQEIIFPAKKIKFSATGDNAFTDEELIRFHNYYYCDGCNTEWEEDGSCQCDDKCPDCGVAYSPYFREDINDIVEE